MLTSQTRLPVVYRIVDSVGAQLVKWGVPIAQMDFQTLHHAAERNTGLNDFGDPRPDGN